METASTCRQLATLLIALAAACSARAQEAQQSTFGQPGFGIGTFTPQQSYLDLDAGVAYTDNALLTATDRMSTGIGSAGFDVDYNRIGSMLDVAAVGDVDWLQYFDNAYPARPYGNFNGVALWGHPTDLFQWLVQETFGDGLANPLAAPTLDELENINYFTTGPYLNLNFSPTERLSFYGLYSDTAYQTTPYDFQTYDGGAVFNHELSASSSLSLQVDSALNDFNDTGVAAPGDATGVATSNYDMSTAEVIYNVASARTRMSAGAGYTLEDYESPQTGSPLLSLDLTHRVSPSSTLFVHAHDEYLTYGQEIRSEFAAPTGAPLLAPAFPGAASAAPLKDRLVSAGWNFQEGRTSFSLSGTLDQQLYAQQTLFDGHIQTLSASVQRQVRPTLSLSLQAYGNHETYGNVDGTLTSSVVNLSLTKKFDRVGLVIFAQRTHQVSTSPDAAALGLGLGTYTEDRVGLNVTYDLVGRRHPGTMLEAPGGLAAATGSTPEE
jgi:hypothetical protein